MTLLTKDVAASTDDAEEYGSPASPSLTSTDLDFYHQTTSWVGIRFQNITIPPGATIISAVVRMTANGGWDAGQIQNIYCEAIDNAPTFTTASGNISSRALTSSVVWTAGAITNGEEYDTADFAAALQEVINRPGWGGGNAIVVISRGTGATGGANQAYNSYNYGSGVPQLRVEYRQIPRPPAAYPDLAVY